MLPLGMAGFPSNGLIASSKRLLHKGALAMLQSALRPFLAAQSASCIFLPSPKTAPMECSPGPRRCSGRRALIRLLPLTLAQQLRRQLVARSQMLGSGGDAGVLVSGVSFWVGWLRVGSTRWGPLILGSSPQTLRRGSNPYSNDTPGFPQQEDALTIQPQQTTSAIS